MVGDKKNYIFLKGGGYNYNLWCEGGRNITIVDI